MEELSIKISKLIIEGNSEVAGGVFVSEARKDLKSRLGTVFGLAEIFELPPEFSDKFFAIINDLETEYYLPPLENEYGLEKRFEECLQRANRRISKAFQETNFEINLENINAVVGLVVKDRIYLSQTGRINAFLFHRKQKHESLIIDILDQADEKKTKINPEKLFSNIISGAITKKDDLFFSNDAIFEHLSQNELMEIIGENTSPIPAQQIKQILEDQGTNDNFYSLIFQADREAELNNIATPLPQRRMNAATGADRHAPDKSLRQLMSTQASTAQYLNPSSMPNWKKILIFIWQNIKKGTALFFKYLYLGIKAVIGGLIGLLTKLFNKNKARGDFDCRLPESRHPDRTTEFGSHPSDSLGRRLSNFINRQMAKFVRLKKFQQVLLIAAFVLIFLFSQSVVWQGQASDSINGSGNVADLVKQTEEKINRAEALNIFNDEEGAKAYLDQADELLAQIPDKKKYKEERGQLSKKIETLRQKLQKLVYLENPKTVANLANQNSDANIGGLAKAGASLFAFDNQNKNIYRIDLANQQVAAANFDLGAIKKIRSLSDKEVILLNDAGDFYKYAASGSTTDKILSDASIRDFDAYGGKIYSLKNGQILKHLPVGSGFNSGSNWIKDGSDLSSAMTLAIDGGIFTAKNDNSITYFENGRAANSFTPEIKPAFIPDQITTSAESNYLYLLDKAGNKIVVIEKNGKLKIQYTSKEFSDTKAMAVDEADKKIYLLCGSKIYRINMDF